MSKPVQKSVRKFIYGA